MNHNYANADATCLMVSIKRRRKRSSRAKRNISMMNSSLESKNVAVVVILKYTRQKCDRHTAAAHGKIFQYRDCVCTECVIKLPRRSLLNEYHSTFAIAFALNLVDLFLAWSLFPALTVRVLTFHFSFLF